MQYIYLNGGMLSFSDNGKILIRCGKSFAGECIIPVGVVSIKKSAFLGCHSLCAVRIPDSVKGIGKWAFFYARSLELIIISNPVTISDFAFYGCESLSRAVVHDDCEIKKFSFPDTTEVIPLSVEHKRLGALFAMGMAKRIGVVGINLQK